MTGDDSSSQDAIPDHEQVSCRSGVTLAGGGPFDAAQLARARALAPALLAADGGADALLSHGAEPRAVIGDMDSTAAPLPEATRRIRVAEQDSTDFAKCLARIDAPLVIGIGFLGGRLDHTLAALDTLVRHAGTPVILLGETDIAFAAPPDWTLTMRPGARVSFYPVMPATGLASTGLRWPVDGLHLAAGTRIGTSNEATGGPVSARFDRPGIVTILPEVYMEEVAASLTRRPPEGV